MMKGQKVKPETRKKMSLAKIGKKRPDMLGNTLKVGIKESAESRKKKSEYMLKNPRSPWLGKKLTPKHRKKIGRSGEKNNQWRGGITPINKTIRHSIDYKLWREAVFKRDNYTCIWCGEVGGKLNADHIKPFALYPELRFAIDNGRTLCVPCHKTTDTFGGKFKIPITKP